MTRNSLKYYFLTCLLTIQLQATSGPLVSTLKSLVFLVAVAAEFDRSVDKISFEFHLLGRNSFMQIMN